MRLAMTAGELAQSIKMGDSPILIDGWLLGVAVDAVRRPPWWLAILPLSSIVGVLGAAGVFLVLVVLLLYKGDDAT